MMSGTALSERFIASATHLNKLLFLTKVVKPHTTQATSLLRMPNSLMSSVNKRKSLLSIQGSYYMMESTNCLSLANKRTMRDLIRSTNMNSKEKRFKLFLDTAAHPSWKSLSRGNIFFLNINSLKAAQEYTADENQRQMLENYVEHFIYGK
jgi:hypothetical protein